MCGFPEGNSTTQRKNIDVLVAFLHFSCKQSPSKKILTESANNVRKMSIGHESNGQAENGVGKSANSLVEKSVTPFDPSLEPLLRENPRRFVIFPIQYHDIWQMYKKVCIP